MKMMILFLLCSALFLGCETPVNEKKPDPKPKLIPLNKTEDKILTNKPNAFKNKTIKATYQSCTVYAGSTHFYFLNEEKKPFHFVVSNDPALQKMAYPTFLVNQRKKIEGPAGPEPTAIGKKYELTYKRKDVVKVTPLD